MIEAPSILLAFAAGILSFLSPCCLPLVPGYLAAIGGGQGLHGSRPAKSVAVAGSLLFIATFSLVFILLGMGATAAGALLIENRRALNVAAGLAIIALGLLLAASVVVLRLNRQWQPRQLAQRVGRGGPVVAGAAFALAWTPCVGPTLGAVLGLASTGQGTLTGGALLAVYSAGLGIPFLLCAVAFDRMTRALAVFKRHYAGLQVAAGLALVGMGVLVVSGAMFRLNIEAQRLLSQLGLDFFYNL